MIQFLSFGIRSRSVKAPPKKQRAVSLMLESLMRGSFDIEENKIDDYQSLSNKNEMAPNATNFKGCKQVDLQTPRSFVRRLISGSKTANSTTEGFFGSLLNGNGDQNNDQKQDLPKFAEETATVYTGDSFDHKETVVALGLEDSNECVLSQGRSEESVPLGLNLYKYYMSDEFEYQDSPTTKRNREDSGEGVFWVDLDSVQTRDTDTIESPMPQDIVEASYTKDQIEAQIMSDDFEDSLFTPFEDEISLMFDSNLDIVVETSKSKSIFKRLGKLFPRLKQKMPPLEDCNTPQSPTLIPFYEPYEDYSPISIRVPLSAGHSKKKNAIDISIFGNVEKVGTQFGKVSQFLPPLAQKEEENDEGDTSTVKFKDTANMVYYNSRFSRMVPSETSPDNVPESLISSTFSPLNANTSETNPSAVSTSFKRPSRWNSLKGKSKILRRNSIKSGVKRLSSISLRSNKKCPESARSILRSKTNSNFDTEYVNSLEEENTEFEEFWDRLEKDESRRTQNESQIPVLRCKQIQNYYHGLSSW